MSTAPVQNPQAIFYQQYQAERRDEIVGVLLALFLGSFGIHHFYLRRTGLGVLYCCFFWSGIPALLGIIECFFMPGRVREYNAIQAAAIAAHLGIAVPGWDQSAAPLFIPPQAAAVVPVAFSAPVTCARCQAANPPGARFCSACGNGLGQ
jgi:TM2 domain-containing membrane protein YozV/ribosomal protein L40E